MGFLLEPWIQSTKRKAIQSPKFYFFDTGVSRMLLGIKAIERNSNLYSIALEHFIAMELRAYPSYRRIKEPLAYWRSQGEKEVDFLIGTQTAIVIFFPKFLQNFPALL